MADNIVNIPVDSLSDYDYLQFRIIYTYTQDKNNLTTLFKPTLQIYSPWDIEIHLDRWYLRIDDDDYIHGDNGRVCSLNAWLDNFYKLKEKQWTDIYTFEITLYHNAFGIPPKMDDGTTIHISYIDDVGDSWTAAGLYAEGTVFNIPNIINSPSLLNTPNFYDDENPTITYRNTMGEYATTLRVCIQDGDNGNTLVAYRNMDKSATSYTIYITDAERKALRKAATKNTKSIRYIMDFSANDGAGSSTNYSATSYGTLTIRNPMPVLSAVVEDINIKTTSLTNNSNVVVKGASNMSYVLFAEPQKESTIVSYSVTCGKHSSTSREGVFEKVESNQFIFKATDSRGNTTTLTYPTLDMINYFGVTCSQVVKPLVNKEDGSNSQVRLTMEGNYFNNSFGYKDNTLSLYVRHTQNDGTMGDWVELTPLIAEIKDDKYILNADITGLDASGRYIFQCKAVDALGEAVTSEYPVDFKPVFDWSSSDFNFNVPVSIDGEFIVDYIVEQGTEPMGTNGTWYWSKWKSGKAECYGTRNFGKMAINTAWGGMYIVSGDYKQAFPTGLFIEAPYCLNMTLQGYSGIAAMLVTGMALATTKDSTGNFQLARGTAGTLDASPISFHAIGRWR